MPDIPVGSQIFDLCFAPAQPLVYTALLNGEVKAFAYDEQGQHEHKFTVRASKKSCRGLALNKDGSKLYAVNKAKSLVTVDAATGTIVDTRAAAHDSPINRVKHLRSNIISTGDDDGVVKLWDTRKPDAVRAYTHHFDFISDFLWLEDKKQLVCTSGDGTLSVLDIRSNKKEPLAQSEDQEDELLSIVPIKGGTKFVVGTQQGILSVFNRASGWGDCVDRVPGHPSSIDALAPLPSRYPSAHSTILTGSSDGLLRVVQLFPTKLLGAIADHGEFPIERMAVDMGGEGRFVGSVAHEEVLKLTDLRDAFEDEDKEGGEKDDENGDAEEEAEEEAAMGFVAQKDSEEEEESEEEEAPKERKKRKRGKDRDPLNAGKRKKGRNEMGADKSFFADL